MFLLDDGNHRFGLHISWLWKMGFAACGSFQSWHLTHSWRLFVLTSLSLQMMFVFACLCVSQRRVRTEPNWPKTSFKH